MKILVLESSPHKHGSSNLLADEFIRGARENGNDIEVIDVNQANIGPCLGCDYCGMAGPCIQDDDMTEIRAKILGSDMVVFVTPLYYFGMSAQLKTLIDRFYAFNGQLTMKPLKSALIAAAWNNDRWTMKDLKAHYDTLCKYLNLNDQGTILGTGCGTVGMTKRSKFPELAYRFGKSV